MSNQLCKSHKPDRHTHKNESFRGFFNCVLNYKKKITTIDLAKNYLVFMTYLITSFREHIKKWSQSGVEHKLPFTR